MTKMFSKLGFKNDEDLSKEDQRELAKWLDVICKSSHSSKAS
jgi:hypothetical protein